jgi:hypothetical protein
MNYKGENNSADLGRHITNDGTDKRQFYQNGKSSNNFLNGKMEKK